jgi:hypothetical protein
MDNNYVLWLHLDKLQYIIENKFEKIKERSLKSC